MCKKGGTITPPVELVGTQHYADWPGLANSPWPMFMHDPQHTGRSPYKGPQIGAVQWRFDATSWVYSSPVIDQDGTIYVGSSDHYFYAISPDGSVKWKYLTLGEIITSAILASDGTIYVIAGVAPNASNSALYALDRSGNLKWNYQLHGFTSFCDPTIAKDGKTVYVHTGLGYNNPSWLSAITSAGVLRWTLQQQGDSLFDVWSPAFSPDGTTLYVTGIKYLFAVDTSGTLRWEFYTGGDVSSPAVDNDGNVYITSDKFYSINPNGRLQWSQIGSSGNEPPAPSIGWDGTIYASLAETGLSGDYIHAYNKFGTPSWTQYVGGFSQGNPISDIDGTVYVGSVGRFLTPDSTNLYAINANGTYKFKVILRSPDGSIPDITSRPAIGSLNKLYVGCDKPHGQYLFSIQ